MKLRGTAREIFDAVVKEHPRAKEARKRVMQHVPYLKRQISPYQGMVLYAIARQFHQEKRPFILEIGTAWGYSAAYLAEAVPNGNIVTLNPKWHEIERARRFLKNYTNVFPVPMKSWDYLSTYDGPLLDMVWIDGNHDEVRHDLPWYNWLRKDGLILFHDYAPADAWRPCPVVYDTVNEFADFLGREPDILVVDDGKVGIAGFYKGAERWGD